jgi:hypothetical protein
MDMPRGKRGDSLNCPIYNALKDLGVDGISGENGATFVGASSGEDHWLTEAGPSLNGGGDHTIESWHVDEYGEASLVLTGTEFSDFVGAFDGGAYPDLAFSEED